jgi:hypothetical protein
MADRIKQPVRVSQSFYRALAWLAPLLAFVVYGSWAYWVHRHADSAQSLRAGLAQGSYAVLSTVALRHIVLALERRFASVSVFALSVAIIVLVPATLHILLGNAQPWLAIAPGVAFGTTYIALLQFYWRTQATP